MLEWGVTMKPRMITDFSFPGEVEEISRRNLLGLGISLVGWMNASKLTGSIAYAGSFPVKKKLIWIQMNGGWDILESVDPKTGSTSGIDMIYDYGLTHSLGSNSRVKLGRWLPNLARHGDDIVVVRGLDMGTTSHTAGRLYMDTGILANNGVLNAASIPAIVASESSATIPIIQLSGGADPLIDRGLLNPVSPIRADNLELYKGMYPSSDADATRRLLVLDHLKNSLTKYRNLTAGVGAKNDRMDNLASAEAKVRGQFAANVGNKLAVSAAEKQYFQEGGPARMQGNMSDTLALTLKLITEDLVDCVNLGFGGYDTHSNQSNQLEARLLTFDHLIARLVTGLKEASKLDSTVIVVYSDFGRTPKVNGSNGRDHWPVGGALLIGGGIEGGRAVGGTDSNLRGLSVNSSSGEVTTASDSSALSTLNPTHLGGSVLSLCLGAEYLTYRNYLTSIEALTKVRK